MWTIRQTDTGWVLTRDDEQVGVEHGTYEDAVLALATALAVDDAADDEGLLPDRWVGVEGVAFSELLPGGRDFTNVEWSWRDPATSRLPLMLQTQTDMGHFGARLAGYMESLTLDGGVVNAEGRFYDSEDGRAARDLLLGGRTFGVSVDPSEDVEAEFTCVDEDDDGYCLESRVEFTRYEIAGLTMTPFPGFERAQITLAAAADDTGDDDEDVPAEASTVVTSAVPTRPPSAWFSVTEDDVAEYAVEQADGSFAVPLTILDTGQVFGHVARWGQCHIGREDVCVSPPASTAAYSYFHVGSVTCDDGSIVATGAATIGCEHAPLTLDAWRTRDHYANAGSGWADLHVVDGDAGPFAAGALRPGLTDEQVRVLRALAFSGDWRTIGRGLELVAALAVNVPGFPIAREAIAASGWLHTGARPVSLHMVGRTPTALVASGIVSRCPDCARQRAQASTDPGSGEALALLRTLERRTRHLIGAEAQSVRGRLVASGLVDD